MFKISVIFFALFAFSHVLAEEFPGGIFKTPSDSYAFYTRTSTNESTPFQGRFQIKVRASSNASISLSSKTSISQLEFLIGVSSNMETRLRINNSDVVIMKTPKVLSQNEFQTFEITWSDNVFHFAQIDEKQNDTSNLMLYKNKGVFPINYIGLKVEPNGEWFIRELDLPHIFDAYIKTVDRRVLQIGNSLRCMIIQTKNESRPIYVHTPSSPTSKKDYSYVEVPEQTCYNIYVRADHDAHIALATHYDVNPIVEFHFRPRGSFNFTYDYNSMEIGSKFIRDLLNIQEYRGYWIEFDKTTEKLSIGKMGEDAFMERNIHTFSLDYIGLSTSNGNVGDWVIKKYGSCPGNKNDDINKDDFWGDAQTRCYIENPNN